MLELRSYDEIKREIDKTLEEHSKQIFLECQDLCKAMGVEIIIPEGFIPQTSLRLDYVIYVKGGEDKQQSKKNAVVVSTLLSLLGVGGLSGSADMGYGTCVSFMAWGTGFKKYLGGCLSLIYIESFDSFAFQEKPPEMNDLRIWVEDHEGARTAELIKTFLSSNGYEIKYWGPKEPGGGTRWRFWIPDLLPLTTISLEEHFSLC